MPSSNRDVSSTLRETTFRGAIATHSAKFSLGFLAGQGLRSLGRTSLKDRLGSMPLKNSVELVVWA
jgi:hypothetical protein